MHWDGYIGFGDRALGISGVYCLKHMYILYVVFFAWQIGWFGLAWVLF